MNQKLKDLYQALVKYVTDNIRYYPYHHKHGVDYEVTQVESKDSELIASVHSTTDETDQTRIVVAPSTAGDLRIDIVDGIDKLEECALETGFHVWIDVDKKLYAFTRPLTPPERSFWGIFLKSFLSIEGFPLIGDTTETFIYPKKIYVWDRSVYENGALVQIELTQNISSLKLQPKRLYGGMVVGCSEDRTSLHIAVWFDGSPHEFILVAETCRDKLKLVRVG